MLDFQRHETFNSIFNHRQKRQNNVAVLREGPHGYVRRPARLDGYRSVPVARPPPSYVRNSNGQCGSRFLMLELSLLFAFRLCAKIEQMSKRSSRVNLKRSFLMGAF
jgi:hypothetical protein